VHPSAALDAYRLVVVPTLYLVTDENAALVIAAADAGAQVPVTFFSGIVDEDDRVRLGGYPGAFRDLLGVRVEEFFPLASGETASLENGGTATLWSEDVTATAATVLDQYASGPFARRPAVTRRDVGAGGAWHLSTLPDDALFDALLGALLDASGVNPVVDGLPPGVEAVRPRSPDASWLLLANDTGDTHEVAVAGRDLVADRNVEIMHLGPGEVAVIRER
jgi:beta-galactosidase